MTLRLKLAWNTTLIVALILSLTFFGTYFLFKQHIVQSFYKRLQSYAITAAFFHLEKDELNAQKYEEIERKYREIHDESIRFFDNHNKMVFEHDTLTYHIPPEILEQVRAREVYYFNVNRRQFAGIFYQDNEGDYVVLASAVDYEGQLQLDKLRLYLSVFFLVGLGMGFILTLILAKQTFRPFSTLIAKVHTITANNLHARLDVNNSEKDELAALTRAFNLFLARLENGVNSQQNFLKHASHELKTPLAAIISNLEVTLSRARSNTEYRARMESLYTDALHIKSMLNGLLLLSGLEASKEITLAPLRIDELLWDLLEKVTLTKPKAEIHIDLDRLADEPQLLEIYANRDLLLMAIGNFIDNALKFSDDQPVYIVLDKQGQQLQLAIEDQGIGIDATERDPVFDLFYRSAKSRLIPGHGIGLYLSKQILDLHHIKINIETNEPTGTIFNLIFPEVPVL